MKRGKDIDKPATKADVLEIVEVAVSKSQEELALIMAKAFAEVHSDLKEVSRNISDVDNRLILTKEDLSRKIDSTNIRIDELAFNRVKYEDHQKLVERVDKLEHIVHKKGKIEE